MKTSTNRSLATRIGEVHLAYLSLLPAVGTFAALAFLKLPINGLLFLLLGTAAIGIYLGVLNAYTPIGKNALRNAMLLLDGPTWIALSTLLSHTTIAQAIIETVSVEIAAVLIGTFGVVLTSKVPTRDQRVASYFAVGLPLLGMIAFAWFYASSTGIDATKLLILCAAVVQSAITQFRLVNKDEVMRPSEGYIILGIASWILALFVGYGVMFSTGG